MALKTFILKENFGYFGYFLQGLFASIISYPFAILINQKGFVYSLFVALLCYPSIYELLKKEADRCASVRCWREFYDAPFFERHEIAIATSVMLFFGIAIGTGILYLTLPDAESFFSEQYNTIHYIKQAVSSPTGNFINQDLFFIIVSNNLRVLFIFYLSSLIYGAGWLMLLSWQGTILGVASALEAKKFFGLLVLPITLSFYLPWGLLEIVAYVMTGIAGGIISISLFRHKGLDYIEKNLRDSLLLLFLSIILLIIAGVIECSV